MRLVPLATLPAACALWLPVVHAQASVASGIRVSSFVVDTAWRSEMPAMYSAAPLSRPRSMLLTRTAPHFVRVSAVAIGASAVLSLADAPMMREVAKLRSTNGSGRGTSVLVASLGGIVPLSVGSLMWAGGALSHNDAIQNLGVESTQAVLLSGALTIGIKGLIGRSRPNAAPDDPDQFSPGRGFFDASRASFPSGHTSAAFAIATVLSRELSARYPGPRWLIRGALYGAAGSVGLARVYQNVHWPSDILTGATLGTLSGLQALSWHREGR